MLARVLEPEEMDTPDEARDYDAMAHSEVNARFCDDLLAHGPLGRLVLDVGTATAQIPIALCQREAAVEVVALELANHMLEIARENVARAGLSPRIRLARGDAKALPYADASFDTVISNSLIHHIADPATVLVEMWRVLSSGGLLFVRDLCRPAGDGEVDELVFRHSGSPSADARGAASFERQKSLLRASLSAALTVTEIAEAALALGIPEAAVTRTSDRHWTLAHRKP